MIHFTRNSFGAVPPVQIPILLFVYTIVFLICVEFVFLFWLQSSLNVAARQIALKAATNSEFPPEDAANRCSAAARTVGQVFPGYSARVRADFVDAILNGNKAAFNSFDEIDSAGNLRDRLVQLGAGKPQQFWGGSLRGSPGNLRFGGCYALRNPVTNNIVYHAVVHCSGCWPVFLKSMYLEERLAPEERVFALSGWLEGRGSYPASRSGTTQNSNLNESLLASGVRPFLVCSEDGCDVDNGGSQNAIFPNALSDGTSVCPEFQAQGQSRPKVNQISIGTGENNYIIDQWPVTRGGGTCKRCNKCNINPRISTKTTETYCKGEDTKPSGLMRIANCGDIDDAPLYWIGIRYACMGRDAFGRIMNSNGDPNSADFLGRCDHYVMLKPSCNSGVAPMDKVVGEVTNLDGTGGPCPIRRENVNSSFSRLVCRNDSKVITNYENGPYVGGAKTARKEFTSASQVNSLASAPIANANTANALPTGSLDGPLDMAMPYHQLCDICNPGGPMCGKYGTCRNESNLWDGAKTVHQLQVWTNTSFYSLNPMYIQLECKYRRDCAERHCCKDAEPNLLRSYCRSRPPAIPQITYPCGKGKITWYYRGVPNDTPQGWSERTLPRDGGFPHCSTGAVKVLKNAVGECCTADVSNVIKTGKCSFLAPIVQLTPPTRCPSTRDCTGKVNDKFCPTDLPKIEGSCLGDANYPIGNGPLAGPGPSPGSWGTVMPAMSPPTASQCGLVPNQPPGIRETCSSDSKTSVSGNVTTKTTCNTCVKCSPTPIVLSFEKDIQLSSKENCFPLNQTRLDLSYKLLKGSKTQGFLAIDTNRNGKIDDGRELFGNWTSDRYNPDGYTALAFMKDTNRDGLIKGDELKDLLLWSDLNEDGVSQPKELSPLTSLNILELDSGRYVVHKESKKIKFSKDGTTFSANYSQNGFKFKNQKGEVQNGYSWDITFKGNKSDKCGKKNKKRYDKSYLEHVNSFFNKLIQIAND
ncbi:MAG: hypothetical protein QNJ31_05690 [Candidatus Caenarcaniphilales bacterium]|nr:hypothetical protein [Candidatus Caenarcaniphilales bacterium]